MIECKSEADMLTKVNKYLKKGFNVINIDYDVKYKDLKSHFRDVVRNYGDKNVFCVNYPINKIGVLGLTQGFDLNRDFVSFIVVLKSLK